jgi:hypothetical protein
MAEKPEEMLVEQIVAALGRVEEVRVDVRHAVHRSMPLASITAGIAKMIMNEVTTIAQQNSGQAVHATCRARAA